MAAAISSEKIDLLVYGPHKPIVDSGFSDQFVLHKFETRGDLDRLTPAVAEKVRGMAVTYNTVRGDKATLALQARAGGGTVALVRWPASNGGSR